MKHIMLNHVSKHFAVNNILSNSQHGFRQGLSTTTQLTSVIHEWSSLLQKCSQVDVAFLHYRKAFDRVPLQRLCSKLNYYGIVSDSQNWLMSFLTARKQAVVVDGSQWSWRDVTSGVPQGSVIGPTLFLLYINDIQDNIQSEIRLFADDWMVYREICKTNITRSSSPIFLLVVRLAYELQHQEVCSHVNYAETHSQHLKN